MSSIPEKTGDDVQVGDPGGIVADGTVGCGVGTSQTGIGNDFVSGDDGNDFALGVNGNDLGLRCRRQTTAVVGRIGNDCWFGGDARVHVFGASAFNLNVSLDAGETLSDDDGRFSWAGLFRACTNRSAERIACIGRFAGGGRQWCMGCSRVANSSLIRSFRFLSS